MYSGRTFAFQLVRSASVMTYVKLKNNENQVYFLWEKVEVARDHTGSVVARATKVRQQLSVCAHLRLFLFKNQLPLYCHDASAVIPASSLLFCRLRFAYATALDK